MNNTQTTPKDFFLHIGATLALYSAVIAIINLAFSIINYFFPDALAGYFYANSIAWPLSMLVVLVPVLYGIEWFIQRDVTRMPEKEHIWIHRWRVYLTLFLTGIVMVIDLITLINTYLNGEISARFVYKFLVVLVVIGLVFAYYLLRHIKKSLYTQKALSYSGIVLAVLSIVFGFMAVGSPTTQRNLKFDAQRVSDLQNIQWQIVNHWQTKSKLPVQLTELADSISGVQIPHDPETKSSYEYMAKSNLSFELCATFARESQDTQGRGGFSSGSSYAIDMSYPVMDGGDSWKHTEGRVCFERTIDPEKYRPIPAPGKAL